MLMRNISCEVVVEKSCYTWTLTTTFNINSLAPEKFELNFRDVIVKGILGIGGWGLSCEIPLIWMSLDFIDDQSTLVHVMAWCLQATSHQVRQCWLGSLSPYGVTGPQWVNKQHLPCRYRLVTSKLIQWLPWSLSSMVLWFLSTKR